MYFTKITKFEFFIVKICICQKKAVSLHRISKTVTKLVKIFNINKLKFKNYENLQI